MKVFDFENYKDFVTNRIKSMPNRGRGQFRKMSEYLNVHTTLVSQIFKGIKDLTLEQACGVADFFGLSELETEYFISLVQLERAGSERYREILRKQIAELKDKAQDLSRRLPPAQILSEENKAIFYSNWCTTMMI